MDTQSTTCSSATAPILIVEDNSSIRFVLEMMLEEDGYAVATAADGGQALAYLAQHCPSLILLDIGLPVVDGFGVAEQVRSKYGLSVPIVVLTANGRAAEAGRRVGAVAALAKPFEFGKLMQLIGSIVRRGST